MSVTGIRVFISDITFLLENFSLAVVHLLAQIVVRNQPFSSSLVDQLFTPVAALLIKALKVMVKDFSPLVEIELAFSA